jgi:hypothetical protein
MDLGIFRRSRLGVWLWVTAPLALLLLSFAISHYFCLRMARKMLYRSSVTLLMPEMHRQHEAAQSIVDSFGERVGSEAEAVRVLRSQLNDIALRSGFVINSLSVEAPPGGMAGSAPCFRADVRGEGKLTSVVALFEKLQTPTGLVAVESLRMGAEQAGSEPLYKSHFVLRWSFLTE